MVLGQTRMLEFLFWISAKKNVVALALLGATLVTIAPQLSKWVEQKQNPESDHKQKLLAQALEKFFIRAGMSTAVYDHAPKSEGAQLSATFVQS